MELEAFEVKVHVLLLLNVIEMNRFIKVHKSYK